MSHQVPWSAFCSTVVGDMVENHAEWTQKPVKAGFSRSSQRGSNRGGL